MATWVEIPGGLILPQRPNFQAAVPTAFALGTLGDANDRVAWIFRCPKAGELETFGTWLGNVTVAEDLHVSFQDVSLTTGDPDAGEDQFRLIPSGSLVSDGWITSGRITSDGTDSGTRRTVTRGELVAAVIRINSFVAGDVDFQSLNLDAVTDGMGFPYSSVFTTAWIKRAQPGSYALTYSDGTYAQIISRIYPVKATNATAYNTTTTPDERGLLFQLPFNAKVVGGWFKSNANGAANYDLILYDSDGTSILASVSHDSNVSSSSSAFGRYQTFTTEVTLSANTTYRLVVKPTTTTSLTIYDFDVDSAALLNGTELGTNASYTERTDAGAWTNTATKRPWMGLVISQIDVGSGAAASTLSWLPGYSVTGQSPDVMLPG